MLPEDLYVKMILLEREGFSRKGDRATADHWSSLFLTISQLYGQSILTQLQRGQRSVLLYSWELPLELTLSGPCAEDPQEPQEGLGCEDAGLVECRVFREGYRYLANLGPNVGLGSENTTRERCFQVLCFIRFIW